MTRWSAETLPASLRECILNLLFGCESGEVRYLLNVAVHAFNQMCACLHIYKGFLLHFWAVCRLENMASLKFLRHSCGVFWIWFNGYMKSNPDSSAWCLQLLPCCLQSFKAIYIVEHNRQPRYVPPKSPRGVHLPAEHLLHRGTPYLEAAAAVGKETWWGCWHGGCWIHTNTWYLTHQIPSNARGRRSMVGICASWMCYNSKSSGNCRILCTSSLSNATYQRAKHVPAAESLTCWTRNTILDWTWCSNTQCYKLANLAQPTYHMALHVCCMHQIGGPTSKSPKNLKEG